MTTPPRPAPWSRRPWAAPPSTSPFPRAGWASTTWSPHQAPPGADVFALLEVAQGELVAGRILAVRVLPRKPTRPGRAAGFIPAGGAHR
jgi:hypothetical protein